jgi:nitroreductase
MSADTTASDLWTVMSTARAIRRYAEAPVDDDVVMRCLEAATWAPSGGNQQPWRFVLLQSTELRSIIAEGARQSWEIMKGFYGIDVPDPHDASPRSRTLRTMHHYMTNAATVPVCVLFCVEPQRGASDLEQGASIYPAMQNFLLAARAQGLGAATALWHRMVEPELRAALGMPDRWWIAATMTAGWPAGHHGPLDRKPVEDVVSVDTW